MVMACANDELLLHDITERRMRGAATQGRKIMHLLSDLIKGKYSKEELMTGKVAEIEKSWKSYTCISADYLKGDMQRFFTKLMKSSF